MITLRSFIIDHPWIIVIIVVIAIADAVLKLISLWRSARNNQLAWFVFVGIFNTACILPLIYLIFFSKKKTQGSIAA